MKEAPVTLNPKSILIIKPSSLGDIVHTIPAVALVRDAHPDAEITWVINSEFVSLLPCNSDVNHVYNFPRCEFRGLSAPKSLIPWLRQTRRLRPDLALDFQGLLRSALIAKIARANQIYGMSDAREGSRWFYHRVAKVDRRVHAIERYLKLAELAGGAVGRAAARCILPRHSPIACCRSIPGPIHAGSALTTRMRGSGKTACSAGSTNSPPPKCESAGGPLNARTFPP